MKLYLIIAISGLLFLSSCDEVTAPKVRQTGIVGNWVSKSVTILNKTNSYEIETPTTFNVRLNLSEDASFTLIRSTDKELIDDSGSWEYNVVENVIILKCETGLVYNLIFIPENSSILFKSYEFYDWELYELTAILIRGIS